MKKTIYFFTFLSLILGLMFTSCDPGNKFVVLESKINELQKDSIKTHDQLIKCRGLVENLFDETASLQNENDGVVNDLNELSVESKMTIAFQTVRLKKLQDITQSQKDVMFKLKNSMAEALMNYKTDELSVYIQDGKVYVSLQEKLLFQSGSDAVNPEGKIALKSLAQVLKDTKDITVMIEGHTDNVPIKTSLFKDNWDLSTARATSILRVLTADNGVEPSRITAAGRGEFYPVNSVSKKTRVFEF